QSRRKRLRLQRGHARQRILAADRREAGKAQISYYSPATDHIQLPLLEQFRDMGSFVATRAHETLHWAGGPARLNRDLSRYHKDRRERAFEEMLVELGSAMLCADLGIVPELAPRPDHAAYIQSWAEILGSDKRAIFNAAAHAQRAVAYLHDLQPEATAGQEAA
ncbi:zincin-like metallopeptidase domain-containing protein, partial [Agrobacterium fabrum]|uniref:zincin-like metallopeptidase domain-containing protein n=1 Tax=Agrobacterium fabrum TaxID=1176649 RepID=UPI001FCED8DA